MKKFWILWFVVCAAVAGVAQTDSCVITSLPQFWDFETGNTVVANNHIQPACWNLPVPYSSYFIYVTEGQNPPSGTHSLLLSNFDLGTVVLPRIDTNVLSLSHLQVSFAAKAIKDPNYGETKTVQLVVGVMTSPDSAESFTPIYTITQFTDQYQTYDIPFTDYEGDGSYIAIQNPGATATTIYIDDMVLDTIPDCQRPSAISYSHPTANTVLLHGIGFPADGSQVSVSYREEGYTVWQTVIVQPVENSLELENLSASTTYEVFVAPLCDTSLVSNTIAVSTLCDAISTVPYFWDFETNNTAGTVNMPLPECWICTSQQSAYGSGYVNSEAGNHFLVMSHGSNSNYAMVLPAVDTSVSPIHDLMISFKAMAYLASSNQKLIFGMMSDPWDVSTFVAVDTVEGIVPYIYHFYDVPMSAYNGTGTHIAMKLCGSPGHYIFVDDLKIQMMPGCSRPIDISLTDVGLTSADLSWSHDADSTWYIVEYKPIGENTVLYDTTAVISTPTVTLSGLLQNTTYEVRVAAGCYPEAFSEPFIFSTVCGIIDSVPMFWGFENNNSGGTADSPLPDCWEFLKTYSGYSNNYAPYVYDNENWAFSGSKSLYFSLVHGCIVVLPVLSDTLQTNELSLSFYLKAYDGYASNATLDIGVMTDPTDASTFSLIKSLNDISYEYQLFDVDLSSYSGTGKYIAFRDASYSRYFMDNLTLMKTPDCPRPTNPVLLNETGRSAVISWTHDADSTQYIVFHRQVGTVAWQSDTTNTTSFMFDNLTPFTSYEYYIVALCSPEVPSFTAFFSTGCPHDIISVPQTWDFEDATLNEMQPCWSRIVGNYAYNPSYPRVEQWHPYSGSQSLVFYNSEGSMAVMPYVNSEYLDIHELQISFYLYNARGDQYAGSRLEVGVMTDPTDPSTFTFVRTLDSIQKAFVFVTVPFFEYEGNGTYIAFRDPNPYSYNSMSSYYDIYIDSLTIAYNNNLPCAMPSQLTVLDVAGTSAVVVWQDYQMDSTTYLVYYKPSSDSIWQVDTVCPGSLTYTLQNLESETSYDCYVVAVCNPDMPSETVHFLTDVDSVGVAEYLRLKKVVLLYPNPARDYMDIRVTDPDLRILGIEVYDVYGKLVRIVVGANNYSPLQTIRIDVSGLAKGAYLVRIQTDKGAISKKMLKADN